MAKTTIGLTHANSIWPVVEKWAAEYDYELQTTGEVKRYYAQESKDGGKINLNISQVNQDVHISAWFSDMLRNELAIDSSSLYSALPRKKALSEIRELSTLLGYTPPGRSKTKKKGSMAYHLGRSIRKLSGKK